MWKAPEPKLEETTKALDASISELRKTATWTLRTISAGFTGRAKEVR